jgi:hypothetical protein
MTAQNAAGQGQGEPFRCAFQITPSDSLELPYVTRAIYVGVGGDMAGVTDTGDSAIFVGMQTGTILPGCFRQVKVTGTTAASLVGLY